MSKKNTSTGSINVRMLDTKCFYFAELNKLWKADKRYPEVPVQKFLQLNEEAFKFLDIQSSGEYYNGEYIVKMTTSHYIGCIPLLSPMTGLPYGTLTVTERFGEDISELVAMCEGNVGIEFSNTIKTPVKTAISPPLYIECLNFIDMYVKARKVKWHKFTNVEKIKPTPEGTTRWSKYASKSYEPYNLLKYPNSCNVLTNNHKGWEELDYVLNLCINEVQSTRTPKRLRLLYRSKMAFLLKEHGQNNLRRVSEINIKASDPLMIKQLKAIANVVLVKTFSVQSPWRLNFSLFFEDYVQFMLKTVAMQKGARMICNPHYELAGKKPVWALRYIEPDVVIVKDDVQYVIDAKYKFHMYNLSADTDRLRETFRADLHQALAYSSLSSAIHKNVLLIYPYADFISRELVLRSNINDCFVKVYLVGLSIKQVDLERNRDGLCKILN